MNSKKDKIELLKAVRAGRIKPEEIPENPMIISNAQDVWAGFLIGMAQEEEGQENSILFVGDAGRVLDESMQEIDRLHREYEEEDQGQ